MIGVIFIGVFFVIIFFAYYKLMHMHTEPYEKAIRGDKLKPIHTNVWDVDVNDYIEISCKHCKFFDGYDICDCPKHFGAIVHNTIDYCYRDKDFEK